MPTGKQVAAGIIAAGAIAGGGSLAADNAINPYQSVQVMDGGKAVAALQIEASSSLPDAGMVKTLVNTDKPRIELDKWGGQVALGVTYTGIPATTAGSRPFLSKDVEWGSGAQTMQAVPLDATTTYEDGGMEININLASEPASNVFTFQLDNWQNLDFFYQAPLWKEAGLKAPTADCTDTQCAIAGEGTSTRPDNVVGSYAVYYKDHANHVEGQTNYATGKAYHIFRPLVTDANGATTWADLSYANGVLTVTVPQSFLDGATYPVKVDPTFGYTTLGGTGSGSGANNCQFDNAAAGSSGNIVDIQIGASGTHSMHGGLWLNSDNSLVAGSVGANVTVSSKQFYTSTISPSVAVSSGVTYKIAISESASGDLGYFDTGAASSGGFGTCNFATPGNMTAVTNNTSKYSAYADYAAPAATHFAPWQFSDF